MSAVEAQNSGVNSFKGFILQAAYRVVSRPGGLRAPVVHLYGCLQNGETFLIRDDRPRPQFFIRENDVDRARIAGVRQHSPSDRRTFDGASAACIEVDIPTDVPPLRDRLHDNGIETFEADV